MPITDAERLAIQREAAERAAEYMADLVSDHSADTNWFPSGREIARRLYPDPSPLRSRNDP